MSIPCIVITRDRATYTRACIASLERYRDQMDIHIVDHGSTWPPMLDYLKTSPHPVHYADPRPPRDLWGSPELDAIVGRHQRYLVTDPDLTIDPDCPPDWLDQLGNELDRGDIVKAGLGLRLDDLPDTELAAKVRQWEAPFWQQHRPWGTAWSAPVDTTLALYPTLWNQPGFRLTPAARLDQPYLARHLPWYHDPNLDPAETEHYRSRIIPGSSHWIDGGWTP